MQKSSLRLFRCSYCDHKMRLSGIKCGSCGMVKRFYQQLSSYYLVIVAVLYILWRFAE